MEIRKAVVTPDPSRMIEGLRDTGYEVNTAIADLIDNSIAAKATKVDVHMEMDYRGNIQLSIADNGTGMDEAALINAMKYGSQKRHDPASLGKFGLGLKTASTAFCRELSVITRPSGNAAALQATWDLDHIAKPEVDQWELLLPDPDKKGLTHLDKIAAGSSGTVVLWKKVDRMLNREYSDPSGGFARNALDKIKKALQEHVAMVYQRFLDPEDKRARNVEISIDGVPVKAWDPFCVGVADLIINEDKEVELGDGREAAFSIRVYVLPRKEEFANDEAAKAAKISNDRQGIYIYREQRLIHDASWLGMYQKEPHFSLLRIEFSFDHHLDDAFHVDIKKSRILLNDGLSNWLSDEFLPAPRRAAEQRYRMGVKKKTAEKSKNAHDGSNSSISSKEQELDTSKIKVIDGATGDVEITNKEGKVKLRLKISSPAKPGEYFVQPTDSIDDGLLWEPALIDGHKAVRINTSHPYYHKVYVPNLNSGVTVQGMDSLLWTLCAAELGTINESSKRHFQELRFEVSRLLRRLVEDLPEPAEIAQDEAA